jgi:phage/plasmid-associated DNA primase
VWFHHPDRRQFIDGVTFDPANVNANPNVFNLWTGFDVEPRQGSWGKLQEHLLTNICDTDTTLFDHLLNLLADMVQHPEKQGEIAIVLRGKEGCGKGTLAKALVRTFGQHGLHISNGHHFVGRFNLHLRDCCFLFVDEAFFAGDKQHVGVLKALITEPLITIEGKYANAVQAPNFLHVFMATNEDWAVPASLGSRRFVVFDVSDTRIGDHAYFAAIDEEMNSGGYEAMLYDLLHRDLTDVNLRAVLVTDALIEQRKRSLDTFTSWWMDSLQRGYVFESRHGLEDHFQQWYEFVTTELLYSSYLAYANMRREHHPLIRELFGKSMIRMGAKPQRQTGALVGEHMVDVISGQGGRVAEPIVRAQLAHGYHFGTLDQAREAFTASTDLAVVWESVS